MREITSHSTETRSSDVFGTSNRTGTFTPLGLCENCASAWCETTANLTSRGFVYVRAASAASRNTCTYVCSSFACAGAGCKYSNPKKQQQQQQEQKFTHVGSSEASVDIVYLRTVLRGFSSSYLHLADVIGVPLLPQVLAVLPSLPE